MVIHDCEQLSDIWWEKRRGIPTASDFHRIITAKDGLPSKSQLPYAQELAKDLQCQNPNYFSGGGKPVNVHMTRGRNLEEEAVAWYAMTRRVEVRKVGFVTTDCGRFGCSPDALIWDKENNKWLGGIEVKCPAKDKHDAHVKRGTLPMTYKAQNHGGMAVTGLPYWIFLEYCPDSTVPTLCLKVEPDAFTEALKVQLEVFDKLYSEVKAKLGVTMEEPKQSPAVQMAVNAWKEKLATGPGIATLNDWLPEMASLPMDAKRPTWEAIKAYGLSKGWNFSYQDKRWLDGPQEAPVDF